MGFWYYCAEKCCGANAYINRPSSVPYQNAYIENHHTTIETFNRSYAPLGGNPPAIDRQSDDWVLLKDGYGIRSDGSLWRWVSGIPFNRETGEGKIQFFDPGPWVWVSAAPNDDALYPWPNRLAAGIKADGTLWVWGSGGGIFSQGDGVLHDWSWPSWQVAYYGLSPTIRLDCPIASVVSVFGNLSFAYNSTSTPEIRFTNSGLSYALVDTDQIAGRPAAQLRVLIDQQSVYYIQVTSGGSGYTSNPEVVFTPKGAVAQSVVVNGEVTYVRVMSGGTYSSPPAVSFVGGGGSGASAVAHADGNITAFEVLDGGTGYNVGIPTLGEVGGWFGDSSYYTTGKVKVWCDPPPCAGHVNGVSLYGGGSGYLLPATPTIHIGGPGNGATAVATLDATGSLTSIQVTSGGSGYKTPGAAVIIQGDGQEAAAAAIVDRTGKIVSIRIINPGHGYTKSGTAISLSPVTQTPAVVEPVIDGGKIIAVNIISGGSGYFIKSPPKVTITPIVAGVGGGASAVAVVNDSFQLSAINLVSVGSGYMKPAPPTVTVSSQSGSGAEFVAEVNNSGVVTAVKVVRAGSGYPPVDMSLVFTPASGSSGSGAFGVARSIRADRHPTSLQPKIIGLLVAGIGKVHSATLSQPIKLNGPVNGGLPDWRLTDCPGETIGDGAVSGVIFPPLKPPVVTYSQSTATTIGVSVALSPKDLCEAPAYKNFDVISKFTEAIPLGCTKIGPVQAKAVVKIHDSPGQLESVEWAESYFSDKPDFSVEFTPPEFSVHSGDAVTLASQVKLGEVVVGGTDDSGVSSWLFASGLPFRPYYEPYSPPFVDGTYQWASPEDKNSPAHCKIETAPYVSKVTQELSSYYPYPAYPSGYDILGSFDIRASVLAGVKVPPSVPDDPLGSDFRPKCKGINRDAFLIPDADPENGIGKVAVLEAQLQSIGGYVYVTGFTVTDPGDGFTKRPSFTDYDPQPSFVYGPSRAVYDGARKYHIDSERPRKIDGSGWTSVEVVGTRKIVAVRDKNVYHWGEIDSIYVTEPTRVGSSAVVRCSQVPSDRIGDVIGVVRPVTMSSPENGLVFPWSLYWQSIMGGFDWLANYAMPVIHKWTIQPEAEFPSSISVSRYGDFVVDIFRDKPKHVSTKYFVKPVVSTPSNFGYLSPPSVTYHSLQPEINGVDPFNLQATIHGPDGTASSVIRTSDGYYGILCSDGSLWSMYIMRPFPYGEGGVGVVGCERNAVQRKATLKSNYAWGDLELGVAWSASSGPYFGIGGDVIFDSLHNGVNSGDVPSNRTFSEIVSQTRSYDYLITLESGGSGYTSESKIVFGYEHLSRPDEPAQVNSTSTPSPCNAAPFEHMAYKSLEEWTEAPVVVKHDSIDVTLQYGGAIDGSGRIISLPIEPLLVRSPEHDPEFVRFVQHWGQVVREPAQPWYYYDRLGRGINGAASGTAPYISLPHVLLNSVSPPTVHVEGPGSGAVFSVTKITDSFLQSLGGSGWNRVGTVNEKWSSVFAPRIGITVDGTVRRPIASGVSQPAGSETDGFVSVSLSRDPSLTAAYKTDGSIHVTDGVSARIHNELEMKVTIPGSGLTLVPTATLDQVPGVAKLSAQIDGKVVAFGVVNGGSGYTLAPSVTVTTRSGDSGSGAAGKAHICGPVVSMSVTTAGSGYKSPPRIKFSRPGLPAKATPRMKGFVDSITITDSGYGYTSVPNVSLIGDGKDATAKATIKGVVSEIVVTGGGRYSKAPTVTVDGGGGTGCKAVAAVSPSGDSYTVSRVIVTDSGVGYTSPPTVSFSPPGAKAQAVLNAGVDSISITKAGEGYTSPPSVSISGASAISHASAVAGLSLAVDSISIERGGRYWYTPTATIVPRETITKLSLTSGGTGYSTAPDILLVAGSGKGARASCKISGSVSTISILDGGVGYSEKYPPYVTIVGGYDVTTGRQAKAKADVLDGKISAVTVTDGGAGYNSVPTVSLKWPVQATATAKVESGAVTSIEVINPGAFYPAVPRVEIRGGGGSGAEAEAVVTDGSVSAINVNKGGSLYASPPDVFVVYDPYGEGASLAATINASVSSVTLESQGEGYKVPPIALFVGGGGDGAAVTVTTKAEGSGAEATCKINGSVQYIELTSQGSGYQYPPVVTMSKPQTGEDTATAQSRILGKITSVSIDHGGSGYKADSPHKAYAFGGQYDLPFSVDGNVSAAITLSANSSGEISSVTKLPQEYFTQRPVIDMENGIGIRLRATLSQACLGVDHIGSKDSGSSKATTPWPWYDAWPIFNKSGLVWRGSLSKGEISPDGKFYPLMNTTAAEAYIENEKGYGGSFSLVDLSSSQASLNLQPRLMYSGGADYISRYKSDDVVLTVDESKSMNLVVSRDTTVSQGSVVSVSAIEGPLPWEWRSTTKVYFTGGGGTGAQGFYVGGGVVKITSGGSGYSAPPKATLVGRVPHEDPLEVVFKDIYVDKYWNNPFITSAVLDFAEQDQRSSHDRLTTPPPDYAHPFYDQGSVVDAIFFYPDPDKIGRWNDSFKKQHSSPPQVSVNIVDGTAPEVKTEIVKWRPPVDDGSFIRDET